jgi:hypothetical protein
VINVGVLFFADFTVGFSGSAEVVGLGARGQGAVVGGIFAVPHVEPLADDYVPVRGPVTSGKAAVEGVSSPAAASVVVGVSSAARAMV